MPVAANCSVSPWNIVGLTGVTVIDSSTGAVTVRLAVPLRPMCVALMVTLPVPVVVTPVTKPPDETVAAVRLRLDQIVVALSVKSITLPSENVPLKDNWRLLPAVTLFDGATADGTIICTDVKIGSVTVTIV